MAAALEEGLGVKAELVEGDHGIFDVTVNGEVVFSKQRAREFVATPDMVEMVRAHLGEGRE